MDSVYMEPPVINPYQDSQLSQSIERFFGAKRTPDAQFDIDMYKARMRITVDMLLMEANERAREADKTAYVHVVGLGLGVWQKVPQQPTSYVETFTLAFSELRLDHIITLLFRRVLAETTRGIHKHGRANVVRGFGAPLH